MVYSNKKKHARRVFLFEEFILFSKAKKQAVQGDCFVYKNSLKVCWFFQVYLLVLTKVEGFVSILYLPRTA